jgi:hypothetical protein
MTKQTLSTSPETKPAISIAEIRAALGGRVITPEDAGYDEARTVFYGCIDRRPAIIVRAKDAYDVSRVVSFAREGGLELAIRSGGHSAAGHGTTKGGIVLDLSEMKGLEIDVGRRTAWAETGLTAGEYTAAAVAALARRGAWQARRHGDAGLRGRGRRGRARHRAVPVARRAASGHGKADALRGDLPTRGW